MVCVGMIEDKSLSIELDRQALVVIYCTALEDVLAQLDNKVRTKETWESLCTMNLGIENVKKGKICWDLRSITFQNFDQNIKCSENVESYIQNIKPPRIDDPIIYYV